MQKLKQRYMSTTLIKYFISYFLILALLTLGYSAAFHSELKKVYSKEIYSQATQQMERTYTELRDSFATIDNIQLLLTNDTDVIMSRYKSEQWFLRQTYHTLAKYVTSNNCLDGICYIHFDKNHILSTRNSLKCTDSGYVIYLNGDYIPLPVKDFVEATQTNARVFVLKNGKSNLFLYFPCNENQKDYTFFYILSQNEIKDILSHGQIPGVESVCLLDEKGQSVLQYGTPPLTTENQNDILTVEKSFFHTYTLKSYLSDHTILEQTSHAFKNACILLSVLSLFGMALIFLVMQLTYRPLHKLTKKLLPSSSQNTDFVEQLDQAFSNVLSENQQLRQKINTYRVSIQKSLLDSIVQDHALLDSNTPASIDRLFCMEPDSHIFLLRISASEQSIGFPQDVQQLLNDSLPGTEPSVTLLECHDTTAVLLIYYAGFEPNKDDILHSLLTEIYQDKGYFSAISDSAESPMEIPQLYDHTQTASEFWNQAPVIKYSDIEAQISDSNALAYPYTTLNTLTDALKACQITQAKEQILHLFELLDTTPDHHLAFPDFYTRCILIDILTILSDAMNNINIKFKSYSELYFDALFLCRSCSYEENRENIQEKIFLLLNTYEAEYQNSIIQVPRIEEIIQNHYSSPDFTISALADTFHVSVAYMSYFFKKNFNTNFSDYLWNIRMEKAKELLHTTDMNIDQICVAVGYLNASSFRRKFKQETGLTPSQYRANEAN